MASIELCKLFLASPSDVQSERQCVYDVVTDINASWANHKDIRLEVVGWETHALPSYGSDPQDLINKQLSDMQNFDLFIGIMWNRFGKPTPRAVSGTGEEFERAVESHSKNRKPEIMFFFRQAAAIFNSPEECDQRSKVITFKNDLQDKAIIGKYTDPANFRVEFNKCLMKWLVAREAYKNAQTGGLTLSQDPTTNLVQKLTRRTIDPRIDPIDEAAGYQKLMALGHTQKKIGALLNRNQPYIANMLRLLELPQGVQAMLSARKLSPSHGIALCSINHLPDLLVKMAHEALAGNWSSEKLRHEVGFLRKNKQNGN